MKTAPKFFQKANAPESELPTTIAVGNGPPPFFPIEKRDDKLRFQRHSAYGSVPYSPI